MSDAELTLDRWLRLLSANFALPNSSVKEKR